MMGPSWPLSGGSVLKVRKSPSASLPLRVIVTELSSLVVADASLATGAVLGGATTVTVKLPSWYKVLASLSVVVVETVITSPACAVGETVYPIRFVPAFLHDVI